MHYGRGLGGVRQYEAVGQIVKSFVEAVAGMDAQAVLRGFDDSAVSVKAEYRIVHQDGTHAAQGRAQSDFNFPVIEPDPALVGFPDPHLALLLRGECPAARAVLLWTWVMAEMGFRRAGVHQRPGTQERRVSQIHQGVRLARIMRAVFDERPAAGLGHIAQGVQRGVAAPVVGSHQIEGRLQPSARRDVGPRLPVQERLEIFPRDLRVDVPCLPLPVVPSRIRGQGGTLQAVAGEGVGRLERRRVEGHFGIERVGIVVDEIQDLLFPLAPQPTRFRLQALPRQGVAHQFNGHFVVHAQGIGPIGIAVRGQEIDLALELKVRFGRCRTRAAQVFRGIGMTHPTWMLPGDFVHMEIPRDDMGVIVTAPDMLQPAAARIPAVLVEAVFEPVGHAVDGVGPGCLLIHPLQLAPQKTLNVVLEGLYLLPVRPVCVLHGQKRRFGQRRIVAAQHVAEPLVEAVRIVRTAQRRGAQVPDGKQAVVPLVRRAVLLFVHQYGDGFRNAELQQIVLVWAVAERNPVFFQPGEPDPVQIPRGIRAV